MICASIDFHKLIISKSLALKIIIESPNVTSMWLIRFSNAIGVEQFREEHMRG